MENDSRNKVFNSDEVDNVDNDISDGKEIKYLPLGKFIKFIIIMALVYSLSGPIISSIYNLTIKGHIIYTLPYINAVKFFATACVFMYVIYKFMNFTYEGRKIVPYLLFIAVSGLMVSISSFNYVSEDKLIEYRMFIPFKQQWDEIDYVDTHIYKVKSQKNKKPKVRIKYLFVFESGKKMNVWSNVSDNMILHEYILNENLPIHHNDMKLERFIVDYEPEFNGDMESIVYMFYGKQYNE